MYRTKHIIVECHQFESNKPIPEKIAKTVNKEGVDVCHWDPAEGEAWVGKTICYIGTRRGPTFITSGMWIVKHPQLGILVYDNDRFWGLIEQI